MPQPVTLQVHEENPLLIVDHDGRVVAANEQARRRFGQVEGRLASDLVLRPVDGHGRDDVRVVPIGGSERGGPLEAEAATDRVRSAFLANMSHELRTPLTSVIGFAKLLRSGRGGPLNPTQRHYVERVLEGGQHLLHLVCDLLDLARIESGHLELRPEDTDLSLRVEETVAAVKPLADAKDLHLHQERPGQAAAFIDPVRFKQVLYNYLSNAIKFTPPEGAVTVRLARKRGEFLLEVSDTGIGIPAEEIPRLFTEFTQLENGADAPRGAGLGLAITRRIVEAMGGSVGVTSSPGTGSTFWARFPHQGHATPSS